MGKSYFLAWSPSISGKSLLKGDGCFLFLDNGRRTGSFLSGTMAEAEFPVMYKLFYCVSLIGPDVKGDTRLKVPAQKENRNRRLERGQT